MSEADSAPRPLVALSTASVYPDRTPDAFEVAARLGYDGVEVMVTPDAVSQDVDVLRRLADYHHIPVLAVHAPCLLITQRVWGRDPWGKLVRAKEVAEQLGARVVVVHPPFRWQRDYARDFGTGLARMQQETDVVFAVENMFPLRARGAEVAPYAPDLEPGADGLPARHPGPVAHRRVRLRRAGHGRRARRPAGPRAPGRRHRAGLPRRAPGARAGHPAVRAAAAPAGRRQTTRGWSCWRSRRSARRPRRPGRRTWPRRWSSPGPTWPPRRRAARGPAPARPARPGAPAPGPAGGARPAHRRPGSASPPSR